MIDETELLFHYGNHRLCRIIRLYDGLLLILLFYIDVLTISEQFAGGRVTKLNMRSLQFDLAEFAQNHFSDWMDLALRARKKWCARLETWSALKKFLKIF